MARGERPSPDFIPATEHLFGRTFVFGTNLMDHGLPSNLVAAAR